MVPSIFEVPPLLYAVQVAQLRSIARARDRAGDFKIGGYEPSGGVDLSKRSNGRVFFEDSKLGASLASKISEHLQCAVTCSRLLAFYRYAPGEFYSWHVDHGGKADRDRPTTHTLIVHLNNDYQGGGTLVKVPDAAPYLHEPAHPGSGFLFAHSLQHAGLIVQRKSKYLLRADLRLE